MCSSDRRFLRPGRFGGGAGSSGRSVRFASAIRLDALDQHGSDAASNGLENSRSRTERRTRSQSRQWRATAPSAAPTAPRSSPCASPPVTLGNVHGAAARYTRVGRSGRGSREQSESARARVDSYPGRAAATEMPPFRLPGKQKPRTVPGPLDASIRAEAQFARRLRLRPSAARPSPSSASVPGSGTSVASPIRQPMRAPFGAQLSKSKLQLAS